MCDTQVLIADNGVWLAKNSDREPAEPQAVVRRPAVRGDTTGELRVTHVTIAQVPDRHAVILSKPTTIWGAEMGVNDCGVAIGNEAIFSRRRSRRPALLGMDFVRLGLERAATAERAVEVITALLERHGQGGPAGYREAGMHYDNSYLIADPRQAWLLETAGRDWAARRILRYGAISNALTLDEDYDRAGPAVSGPFARQHDGRLLPFLARARERRDLSLECLATAAQQDKAGFIRLVAHLRRHAGDRPGEPAAPLAGSNRDVCMHAAGPIRRSQTTGSLIVRLGDGPPRLAVTGSSAPCLSIFRPLDFEPHDYSVLSPREDAAPLWQRWQPVQRAALFSEDYRRKLRAQLDALEQPVLAAMMRPDAELPALDRQLEAGMAAVFAIERPPRRDRRGAVARFWDRVEAQA